MNLDLLESFGQNYPEVSSKIQKNNTVMREPLSAKLKLQIACRYLATGDSLGSLQYLYRVPKCTISQFLPDVFDAIYEVLKDYVMTAPEEFVKIHSPEQKPSSIVKYLRAAKPNTRRSFKNRKLIASTPNPLSKINRPTNDFSNAGSPDEDSQLSRAKAKTRNKRKTKKQTTVKKTNISMLSDQSPSPRRPELVILLENVLPPPRDFVNKTPRSGGRVNFTNLRDDSDKDAGTKSFGLLPVSPQKTDIQTKIQEDKNNKLKPLKQAKANSKTRNKRKTKKQTTVKKTNISMLSDQSPSPRRPELVILLENVLAPPRDFVNKTPRSGRRVNFTNLRDDSDKDVPDIQTKIQEDKNNKFPLKQAKANSNHPQKAAIESKSDDRPIRKKKGPKATKKSVQRVGSSPKFKIIENLILKAKKNNVNNSAKQNSDHTNDKIVQTQPNNESDGLRFNLIEEIESRKKLKSLMPAAPPPIEETDTQQTNRKRVEGKKSLWNYVVNKLDLFADSVTQRGERVASDSSSISRESVELFSVMTSTRKSASNKQKMQNLKNTLKKLHTVKKNSNLVDHRPIQTERLFAPIFRQSIVSRNKKSKSRIFNTSDKSANIYDTDTPGFSDFNEPTLSFKHKPFRCDTPSSSIGHSLWSNSNIHLNPVKNKNKTVASTNRTKSKLVQPNQILHDTALESPQHKSSSPKHPTIEPKQPPQTSTLEQINVSVIRNNEVFQNSGTSSKSRKQRTRSNSKHYQSVNESIRDNEAPENSGTSSRLQNKSSTQNSTLKPLGVRKRSDSCSTSNQKKQPLEDEIQNSVPTKSTRGRKRKNQAPKDETENNNNAKKAKIDGRRQLRLRKPPIHCPIIDLATSIKSYAFDPALLKKFKKNSKAAEIDTSSFTASQTQRLTNQMPTVQESSRVESPVESEIQLPQDRNCEDSDFGFASISVEKKVPRKTGLGGKTSSRRTKTIEEVPEPCSSSSSEPPTTDSDQSPAQTSSYINESESRSATNSQNPEEADYLDQTVDGKVFKTRFVCSDPSLLNYTSVGNLFLNEITKVPNNQYTVGYLRIGQGESKKVAKSTKFSFVYVVITGAAEVKIESEIYIVKQGGYFSAPVGTTYSIKNTSLDSYLKIHFTRIRAMADN